ncbi:MAG: ATP-binding protein [Chloroflexi bacterium]|nr:ATP-binding protein [Chloroflexota bacterium]
MDELVKRSNGVFGKSGTGKSFLTRFLIIGMLQKTDATTLVFDMHNEYGWAGRDPERRRQVKGLKQLFPSRVAVFSLDEASSLRRGIHPDGLVNIGYKQIEPEDVALLAETWRLTPLAIDAAYRLHRRWGAEWLEKFLALRNENLVEEARLLGENFQTVSSLHRSLSSLSRFPFVTSSVTEDSVRRIMEYLERGTHVVLEFGKFQHDLDAYILVANILTRRIEEKYFERREESMGSGGKGPRPLVIVIEEAHKFLNPGVASQTTFGTIAREMRKSNVTLLVIDQRPSGIDPEIMSQLGSKVACLLDNEQDVDAVLAGVSGRSELRGVLARLESTQQALIFGHAVPMPVVVRVREYGSEASYAELGRVPAARRPDRDRDGEDELFG